MRETEAPTIELQPTMAKPGIPVENPQRRLIPDIFDPMQPRVVPKPIEPVRTPSEPVPVGR